MLAVIGGSGVQDIGGLANQRWVRVESPFGAPSDELLLSSVAKIPHDARPSPLPPLPEWRGEMDSDKWPVSHLPKAQ